MKRIALFAAIPLVVAIPAIAAQSGSRGSSAVINPANNGSARRRNAADQITSDTSSGSAALGKVSTKLSRGLPVPALAASVPALVLQGLGFVGIRRGEAEAVARA